ncbi:purine-cytosine permease family protein [Streptomyces gamaensis]|uniref:Purine-cytosine permease family protein n=1 Tax=Streptomyces gamaensis TaxID=1763542 RepID=A0ABW0YV38_9ACTN
MEQRTIEVVPDAERHGTPGSQFTLWFGASMQITAIVDGALAVVFGADALWAIPALLVGNVVGGAVMALHAAQGPRLGVPQMLASRAQFGVRGAVLPLVLVILMYLGFAATGSVLAGQAVSRVLGLPGTAPGIVVFGALTAVVAVTGYRLIHAVGRVATAAGIAGLGWLLISVFVRYDVPAHLGNKPFDAAKFLLAVSLGAGWQLTFGPYVADYSRYLPRTTDARAVFRATFAGTVLGAQWAMTLGALVAAVAGDAFLADQVGFVGRLAGPPAAAFLTYLVVVTGKLTVNCLNAYGGFMSVVTTVTAFDGRSRIAPRARAVAIVAFTATAVVIAIAASADFLDNFKNFVLLLLMVFTPWSAINLIDYYLISREHVDVPALYDPQGRYGRWNAAALVGYAVGVLAQVPFLAQKLYTGPLTRQLGGADISWLVGLVVTGVVYYAWAGRDARARTGARTRPGRCPPAGAGRGAAAAGPVRPRARRS